jgi:hypothetical protein
LKYDGNNIWESIFGFVDYYTKNFVKMDLILDKQILDFLLIIIIRIFIK